MENQQLEAVDSESTNYSTEDGWRLLQVLKAAAKHVTSSTGAFVVCVCVIKFCFFSPEKEAKNSKERETHTNPAKLIYHNSQVITNKQNKNKNPHNPLHPQFQKLGTSTSPKKLQLDEDFLETTVVGCFAFSGHGRRRASLFPLRCG